MIRIIDVGWTSGVDIVHAISDVMMMNCIEVSYSVIHKQMSSYANSRDINIIMTKSNVSGGLHILLMVLSHTVTFRTGSGQ